MTYQMDPQQARQLYDRGFLSRENYMLATGGEDPTVAAEAPSPLTFDIPTPMREPVFRSPETEPAEPPPVEPVSLASDKQAPPPDGQHGFTSSGYGMPPLDLSGYNLQQKAVSEQYKQEADKAKAIYDEMGRFNEAQEKIEEQNIENEKYRQEQSRLKWNKLSEAEERFSNMKVDPGKFWADRTTGDKIMIGIGAVLGAFGKSTTGNRAVAIINQAIERDIDAQKANIGIASKSLDKKQSLYKDMLGIFGDEREAEKAAKVVAYDAVKRRIGQITQGYEDPILRAKGAKLIGEIQVLKSKAVQDYFKLVNDMAYKDALGMKSKTGGMAMDKDTLNLMADTKTTFWHIDRLMKISDKMFKSLRPQMRAESSIHVGKLIGLLRNPLLGGGNLTNEEREYLQDLASDPTRFFSLSSSNRTKLKTLMEAAQKHLENRLNVRGLKTPEQSLGLIKE